MASRKLLVALLLGAVVSLEADSRTPSHGNSWFLTPGWHQREEIRPGNVHHLYPQDPGFGNVQDHLPRRGDLEPTTTTSNPAFSRHHRPGRRVCSGQAPSPVAHHRSGQIRFIYTEVSTSFTCCPGWSRISRFSYGCNKPTCAIPCRNGGVCSSPGKCTCPRGFVGNQCQIDVDECATEKPCAHICRNVFGAYECHCRTGYQLQPDRHSCRRNDSDGSAFEARDLERDDGETPTRSGSTPEDVENEVNDGNLDQDYEIIVKRLTKLEKQLAKGRKREVEATEMSAKLAVAVESIGEMRRAMENVQLMQREIYDMRSKVKLLELESRRMQQVANRVANIETRSRLRCRSLPISSRPTNF